MDMLTPKQQNKTFAEHKLIFNSTNVRIPSHTINKTRY